jgi:hypothetical protein
MNLQQISKWFRSVNLSDNEFTDTRIPAALINDENKFLEDNVEAKTKEITSIRLDIDENIDRIQMLENHQKVVQDELGAIQVFIILQSEARRICPRPKQTYVLYII